MAWALERDERGLIEARAFQEEGVLERAGVARSRAERYAWLVGPEGRRWRGARAGAQVLRLLPGWGWAGRLLDLPGIRWIAARAYRWIADHRSFVSSATGVGRSCGLEDPEP